MQSYTIRRPRIMPWTIGLIFSLLLFWLASVATFTGNAEFTIKFNKAEIDKVEALKMMEPNYPVPPRKPKVP